MARHYAEVSRDMSEAELLFAMHLHELGVEYVQEYAFHPTRKWRFDFYINYWEKSSNYGKGKLDIEGAGIEIEGAIWSRGRHTRGKGYQADLEKYNEATAMGIRVYRFSTEDVLSGKAKEFVRTRLLKEPAHVGPARKQSVVQDTPATPSAKRHHGSDRRSTRSPS